MSFANPLLLLGLLAVPLLGLLHAAAGRRRARYPVRFPALGAVKAALGPRPPVWRRHLPALLALLAVASLVGALARPQVTVAVPVERASVMLVTDVSRSMQAVDVAPSRLDAARAAAERFLDEVPAELRVGLVAFSEGAEVVQSPTTAHEDVRLALGLLETIGGTATGAGLDAALDTLEADVAEGRRPPSAIILLSDGSATDGDAQFDAADRARSLGIPIYTVALGTESGQIILPDGRLVRVPPDPAALAEIAERSGGQAFQAQDSDQLDAVYRQLGSQVGTRAEQREITAAFAGAGLLLVLAALGTSTRWRPRLP